MSLSRFFFPHLPQRGRIALPADEAAHAFRVLRLQVDDRVVLFDGCGYEAYAIVTESKRGKLECEIQSHAFLPRELSGCLVMAVALPKGDRQRGVIERAVELGVHAFVPIQTQRSVAEPTDSAMDRMERYVIEASKQCGRNRLMQIVKPKTWNELMALSSFELQVLIPCFDAGNGCQRWLAHPWDSKNSISTSCQPPSNSALPSSVCPPPSGHASPTPSNTADESAWVDQPILIAVGPEGGFTQDEVLKARDMGWRILRMGDRILRVETAVAALAAFAGQRLAPPEFML